MAQPKDVAAVKERYKEELLAKPNVVGIGTGYRETRGKVTDELCLMALVRRKIPRSALTPKSMVPSRVEGVRTDVIQVGRLRAQASRTGRWRPAPGGVSLGHYRVTAGTFGVVVRDRASGERLILSNNHVLANSNQAQPGDAILQPGAVDGGRREQDTIARLARFIPIRFKREPATCRTAQAFTDLVNLLARLLGSRHRLQAYRSDPGASNWVDAAVARPVEEGVVLDEILDIGVVGGTAPATLGMGVRKSGRSTGFTTGTVRVLDAILEVGYDGRLARFEGQIVTTPMSSPGDSGSLLVAGNGLLAVGLLFAGSEEATIFNPIQRVLDALEVVL